MKKQLISIALVIMLLLPCFSISAFAAPVNTDLNTQLTDTAEYLLDRLKTTISADDYVLDYNDYGTYLLILKSGVSDDTVTDALLTYIKNNFSSDGTTSIATNKDYSSSIYYESAYTYIILMLNELGLDPTDYNSINFVSIFEDYYLNNEINSYVEQNVYAILKQNSDDLSNVSAIQSKMETTVLSYYSTTGGAGLDSSGWGISADNNGMMFTPLLDLYSTSNDTKSKVDAALTWTASLLNADDFTIESYGSKSPDSTALALKFFSEFGDTENAEKAYQGLLYFKSSTTDGLFGEDSYDPIYATKDALWGLLAYSKMESGLTTLDLTNTSTEIEATTEATIETTTSVETTVTETTTPPTGDYNGYAFLVVLVVVASSAFIYNRYEKIKTN